MLERFVDRLGLKDLTPMVQDWGGPIGLGFAGRQPELVCQLIIGDTFAWSLDARGGMRLFSWLMGGPIGRALTEWFKFVPKCFFARGFAHWPAPVRQLCLRPGATGLGARPR